MDAYPVFLVVLGLCVVFGATLPRRLTRRPLSLPTVQVLFGMALFGLVPTLPDVDPVADGITAERLSEFVVIISLAGAGLMIDRAPGWRDWGPTWRRS